MNYILYPVLIFIGLLVLRESLLFPKGEGKIAFFVGSLMTMTAAFGLAVDLAAL